MAQQKELDFKNIEKAIETCNIVIYTSCLTVGTDILAQEFEYGLHLFNQNCGN